MINYDKNDDLRDELIDALNAFADGIGLQYSNVDADYWSADERYRGNKNLLQALSELIAELDN